MTDYTDEEKKVALEMIASIKVVTLSHIVNIIDASQKRGTFKSEEMTFVGGIYDDLKKGLIAAHEKAREELKIKAEKEASKLESIKEGSDEEDDTELAKIIDVTDDDTIPVNN